MRAEDNRYEVPPDEAFGRPPFIRYLPYIYSGQEINQLIAATRNMRKPLVGSMYATLFGLLAATGLRISEALALKLGDVTEDGLIIRETKFRKSRIVPLHSSSQQAIKGYIAIRRCPSIADDSLFIGDSGKTPCYRCVSEVFDRLAKAAGLRKVERKPPRIHDLRHTFAVRSLEQCQHDRQSVSRHMIALATYLGHAKVSHTYWYLHASPLLMQQIAVATEAQHDGGKS
jgi:integrase